MALALGNVLGAVTKITSAFDSPKSLRTFLDNFNNYGAQVKNNFEVNFSGLSEITLFVTNINTPSVNQGFTSVTYNGRTVDIPTKVDYDHDITLTVINDGKGYIYSTVLNFLKSEAASNTINSGFTMTVKAMTGDSNYKGLSLTFEGCRMASVGGLTYGVSDNDISTFEVGFKIIDFSVTTGGLSKASGIVGALNSLVS